MGNLCNLTTGTGFIETIRETVFKEEDGCTPKLEKFSLLNGGKVIDGNGAWVTQLPMNLDFIVTNEYGEQVISDDPNFGIPTRAKYRFRIGFDNKGSSIRNGSYLVPNLREYNWNTGGNWTGIDYRSYAFSTKYSDYPPHAQQELMPDGKDYFYDMTFNRVYSPSQFHDHVKHAGRRQFTGIKEIMPEMDQQCATSAMFFPVNSAVRRNKFIIFLYMFLLDILRAIYFVIQVVAAVLAMIAGIIFTIVFLIIWILCEIMCALIPIGVGFSVFGYGFSFYPFGFLVPLASSLGCASVTLFTGGCQCDPGGCHYFGFRFGIVLYSLHQQKYPECEKCSCRAGANLDMQQLSNSTCCTLMDPNCGGANPSTPVSPCPVGNAPGSGSAFNLLIWGDDICCPNYESEDEICCPDNYGWDSTADGTGDANCYAGGGCYVKVICINPLCIGRNLNMDVINQYIRREKVTVALCNGIMNYFWENAWVNGFLYQFQFRAKLSYDAGSDTYATPATSYCKKVVYLHPNDHTFYYRCTPFRWQTATTGKFIGDTDGVQGGNSSGNDHSEGDMDRHLYFPTTIIDMGSRNQCIQQICLDEKFAEECSVTDQIGSTTFQDITDLVSDAYNLKASQPWLNLGDLFARPEDEIGGDMAQALMQNSMLGVFGYETNTTTTSCDCTVPPTSTIPATGDIEYPLPNNWNDTGVYVDYAVNVNAGYDIQWRPHLFTAGTPTIMTGMDIIDCLAYELSGSSQIVPYYLWRVDGSGGFGTENNDWQYTTGPYQSQSDGWTIPSTPLINSGDYQSNIGALNSLPQPGTPNDAYPPMTQNTGPSILFSQPLFYYFGLRPGETAYNKFIRLYVDEELADSVI